MAQSHQAKPTLHQELTNKIDVIYSEQFDQLYDEYMEVQRALFECKFLDSLLGPTKLTD